MTKGRPNNTKACQLCGLQYLPSNNKQKVCKPCKPEYDRQWNREYEKKTRPKKTPDIRICVRCSVEFKPNTGRHIVCLECRHNYYVEENYKKFLLNRDLVEFKEKRKVWSRNYWEGLSLEKQQESLNKLKEFTNSLTEDDLRFIYKRKGARRQGVVFELSPDDMIIPEVCPILGIPLRPGIGKVHANSPSIDRIDNTKGYIKGNTQVISNKANTMKNDATPEMLLKFADWVYKTYKKEEDVQTV